jgi:hypothetical protein
MRGVKARLWSPPAASRRSPRRQTAICKCQGVPDGKQRIRAQPMSKHKVRRYTADERQGRQPS